MSKKQITLVFYEDDADHISNALSDILCWLNGFKAASEHSSSYWPPSTQHFLQDLNAKIKSQLLHLAKERE